jgi:hypothetical protein
MIKENLVEKLDERMKLTNILTLHLSNQEKAHELIHHNIMKKSKEYGINNFILILPFYYLKVFFFSKWRCC